MSNRLMVICEYRGRTIDLLLPSDLRTDELLKILDEKFPRSAGKREYVRCSNPIAMLTGDQPLSYFGLQDGSTLVL